jgi:hypothetical protein
MNFKEDKQIKEEKQNWGEEGNEITTGLEPT